MSEFKVLTVTNNQDMFSNLELELIASREFISIAKHEGAVENLPQTLNSDLIIIDIDQFSSDLHPLLDTLDKDKNITVFFLLPVDDDEAIKAIATYKSIEIISKPLNIQILKKSIEKTAQQRKYQSVFSELAKKNAHLSFIGKMISTFKHDLASPVSNINTAISLIEDSSFKIVRDTKENTLKKSELINFLDLQSKATKLCLSNINQASNLINAFRRIIYDQCFDLEKDVNLSMLVSDVILLMAPTLKGVNYDIKTRISELRELFTHPGHLSRVIMALLTESTEAYREAFDHLDITISESETSDANLIKFELSAAKPYDIENMKTIVNSSRIKSDVEKYLSASYNEATNSTDQYSFSIEIKKVSAL